MSKKQQPDTEQDSFLSRWSRRKLEHSERLSEQDAAPPEPIEDESTTELSTTESDEETRVLTDEDMPPIESLDENSDYSLFMSKGVSEKLRRMALRKLFSGAAFNIRDGLDDYDDDFTTFESLGDMVTSEMKHREEMKEKMKARELEEQQNAVKEEQAPDHQETGPEPDKESDAVDAQPATEESPESVDEKHRDPHPEV